MRKLVHRLRDKPLEIRKQIVVWSAIGFTAVVFVGWVFSLQYRFNSDTRDQVTKDFKPFTVLKDNIIQFTSNQK